MQNLLPIANGPGPGLGRKKPTATIDSPVKNMRSSIACVRCRRSKVKCVNTGPNTTCRACDASNRDCTYPQPLLGGTPRAAAAAAAGMTINAVAGSGAGGGSVERLEAPKKSKPKKPASSANTAATAASMNTPLFWKECLGASILTQSVWQVIFDEFQLHHSPVLPFLHPPTFLGRLRASTAGSNPSSGNSPPPEKPHSQLLLLGMLTLTARHVPSLVSHHSPALTTPIAVSEFYASALKYRLKNDDDESLLTPALDKVQALLMLSIHEWGQTRKSEAYMWLGIAIRMSGALGLSWVDAEDAPASAPYSPEPESDDPLPSKRRKLDNGNSVKAVTAYAVEKEIRRRTFWAVFILDRALSTDRFFPSGVASTDANRVQLPCEERGFMFGADTKAAYLNSEALLHPGRTGEPQEIGGGERVLAHVVKAMEIWGQIQVWTETTDNAYPMSTGSTYHKLSAALEAFVDSLPHQLEFSPNTLHVHFSTRSSSSYAILHITLFLARITLERKCLPDLPFLSPRPLGPVEPPSQATTEEQMFYSASAERFMGSSRDLVTLISSLEEWNAGIESPFVVLAVERAVRSGLYAFNFPWMDVRGYLTGVSRTPDAEPMGSGEETRKAVEYIKSLKVRWDFANESFKKLVDIQTCLTEHTAKFIRQDDHHHNHHDGGRILADKISRIVPNQDERNWLLSTLIPPTPPPPTKPNPATSTSSHGGGRGPSSEVDNLLLAASGTVQEPASAPGGGGGGGGGGTERWMAVNTQVPAVPVQQQQQQLSQQHPAPKSDEGGSLDALAGFAAQQGKIGNGQDSSSSSYGSRDIDMGDAGVKKEGQQPQPASSLQQEEERAWVGTGTGNWVGVGPLEG